MYFLFIYRSAIAVGLSRRRSTPADPPNMDPIVRYYLPSVIRGVYRFDDAFSEADDEDGVEQFLKAKLRFLPANVADVICQNLASTSDPDAARARLTMPDGYVESRREIDRRAKAFFQSHSYFAEALQGKEAIEASVKYLEIQFVKRILAPLLTEEGLRAVRPQHKIAGYFVDFALEGATRFAIEVDGFGKFATRDDLDDFLERQNVLVANGWRVLRFTYNQVMKSTSTTLRRLHGVLKADPRLRRSLAAGWSRHSLFDPEECGGARTTIELVNEFYALQDWFSELALTDLKGTDCIAIEDTFGYGFPFAAIALSSLYEFLDGVAGVMDINFDLPRLRVCGVAARGAAHPLHPLLSISSNVPPSARAIDSLHVSQHAFRLPLPPISSARVVRFRRDLSVNGIHEKLQYITREVFGYENGTKRFQDKVLKRIFDGRHALGISATGSGKSFCFWLPALLKPGVTFIISPLRSLMRDQRLSLRAMGIASAEFINVDVDKLTQRSILDEVKLGSVRLLYISPERLRIKSFLSELERLQDFVPVNYLAVDEAHCISEWGHDFRPSYLKVPIAHERLKARNPDLQLIALTATAGQQVSKDILGILKLRDGPDGDVVREKGINRENFSYQVVNVSEASAKTEPYHEILTQHLPKALKHKSLLTLLSRRNSKQEKTVGIVFCIYADPHGKHSVLDGTSHYLFETMKWFEPNEIFERSRIGARRYKLEAFANGKVRSFSSKPPTLCPRCHSYSYISKPRNSKQARDDEESFDDEEQPEREPGSIKVCSNCKHEFPATDALTPPCWNDIVRANQNDFKRSHFDILVATKGFGMGIDKSSVRFIIHTSLSSGIESWYQEIGRAGRDNERSHIVLLTDPPNEACQKDLKGENRRPRCTSYRGGCPHGKEALCDYGKQHMFIKGSYPGVESDAKSALLMLDRLIRLREDCGHDTVSVKSSNTYLGRHELAIYRLMVLGLVDDYTVTYRRSPSFDVKMNIADLGHRAKMEKSMQAGLGEYLSRYPTQRARNISSELARVAQEYKALPEGDFDERRHDVYRSVYQHLLVILDHTYGDILKMRYDMLSNLLAFVTATDCRMIGVRGHFEDNIISPSYRCGCCDICAPDLEFREFHSPVEGSVSPRESDRRLDEVLTADQFDLFVLLQLVEEFAEYPTALYRRSRAVLEGAPNNLCALFLAREFSPADELAGNAKRLLRTANERPVAPQDIEYLYGTSPRELLSELLLMLNDTDTTCDSAEGQKFLLREAEKPEHRHSRPVQSMRECMDFFILVDEELPQMVESLKRKADELERAFHA